MNEKENGPVIIGVEGPEDEIQPMQDFQIAIEYIVAIWNDWQDADIVLEKRGISLQGPDGTLMAMSDRIEKAIDDAKQSVS